MLFVFKKSSKTHDYVGFDYTVRYVDNYAHIIIKTVNRLRLQTIDSENLNNILYIIIQSARRTRLTTCVCGYFTVTIEWRLYVNLDKINNSHQYPNTRKITIIFMKKSQAIFI